MRLINIFIGEVYKKDNQYTKRIGYEPVMFSTKDNLFHSLTTGFIYDTDPNCTFMGPFYVDSKSLIPYTSFKYDNLDLYRNTLLTNCYYEIQKLEQERLYRLYLNYTEEEIEKIHEEGMLTIDEKAREYESMNFCAPGDWRTYAQARCNTFTSCHECLLDYLSKTGERKFKKNDNKTQIKY